MLFSKHPFRVRIILEPLTDPTAHCRRCIRVLLPSHFCQPSRPGPSANIWNQQAALGTELFKGSGVETSFVKLLDLTLGFFAVCTGVFFCKMPQALVNRLSAHPKQIGNLPDAFQPVVSFHQLFCCCLYHTQRDVINVWIGCQCPVSNEYTATASADHR